MIYLHDADFVANPPPAITEKELKPETFKHIKALRLDVTELVTFVDFLGKAAIYTVAVARPLRLQFANARDEPATPIKTHLYLAAPMGPALEQAVEQATEVGYDAIHFLRSDRVQYPKQKELGYARLKRIVHASCLQCARLWAPTLDDHWTMLDRALRDDGAVLNICADESAAGQHWGAAATSDLGRITDVAIFIGPEGGWSAPERARLAERSIVFSLGPHVLRVPTAAVAAYVLAWKQLSNETKKEQV